MSDNKMMVLHNWRNLLSSVLEARLNFDQLTLCYVSTLFPLILLIMWIRRLTGNFIRMCFQTPVLVFTLSVVEFSLPQWHHFFQCDPSLSQWWFTAVTSLLPMWSLFLAMMILLPYKTVTSSNNVGFQSGERRNEAPCTEVVMQSWYRSHASFALYSQTTFRKHLSPRFSLFMRSTWRSLFA